MHRILVLFIFLFFVGVVHAGGPWHASERNTHGWKFMTPKERLEHQRTVRAFTQFDACVKYQQRHHDLIESRAKARKGALESKLEDFCEHLRATRR